MSSKYDALRAEFVDGVITLRELAEKHSISYATLLEVAKLQDWHGARREAEKNAAQSKLEKLNAKCEEWESGDITAAAKLRAAAQKRLERVDEMTPQDMRAIAAAFSEAQKIAKAAFDCARARLESATM